MSLDRYPTLEIAMRHPSKAMIEAGFDENRLYRHPSESWPAMIDAALAEGDTP